MTRVFSMDATLPPEFPTWPEVSPPRVAFGTGALELAGGELTRLGVRRAFLVTSPGMVGRPAFESVRASIEHANVELCVWPHVTAEPGAELIDEAACAAIEWKPDGIVGMGGGSVMDAAKLAALLLVHPGPLDRYLSGAPVQRAGPPVVLLPSTAGSGSEVTADAVVTDRNIGTKRALKDHRLLAAVALVDPLATLTCRPTVTAHCGLDALTHAIEALTNVRATEATGAFALEAARLLFQALPRAVVAGDDIAARQSMSLGALLAGYAFGAVGTAAVHACGYPLSGLHGVPHGLANGLMLPHVVRFNRVTTDRYEALERALGIDDLAGSLHELLVRLHLPTRLRDHGIPRNDIARMAECASTDERHLRVNPRTAARADLEALFERAW